jgi:hypothetical protein
VIADVLFAHQEDDVLEIRFDHESALGGRRERARLSGTPYLVKPFPSGAILEAINKVSARDLTPGSGAHHVV